MDFSAKYVNAATPVRKSVVGKAVGFDDKTMTVTHIITSEHEDRYREIVDADGMRVTGHVPVLYGHGYSYLRDDVPVALNARLWPESVDGVKAVLAETRFYRPDEKLYPDAAQARAAGQFPAMLYDMHKQGILTGWSIGFRALGTRVDKVPAPTADAPDAYRDILHFTEWELLEYSTVPVPANPHAVDKMAAAVAEGQLSVADVAPYARQLGASTIARLFPSLAQPGNSTESWLARLAKSAKSARIEHERRG